MSTNKPDLGSDKPDSGPFDPVIHTNPRQDNVPLRSVNATPAEHDELPALLDKLNLPKEPHLQNQPPRFELFYKQPGEKWVTVEPETRVPNAALFKVNKEDHTLANLLRAQLLKSPHVMFAAYKVPHPLFAKFELRVQTDGTITPKEAVKQACRDAIQELQHLSQVFTREWELSKVMQDGNRMNTDY